MKIVFEKLTKNNYLELLRIKQLLFPESNSDEDYEGYFSGKVTSNYFKCDNENCGIGGWYDFDGQHKDAFVGWFGILPQFRRRGIASQALKFIIEETKNLGYESLRVYTDEYVNKESIFLYDKFFDICEDYTFPDKIGKTKQFVVFSKFFTSKREKWNNKPLGEDENYTF